MDCNVDFGSGFFDFEAWPPPLDKSNLEKTILPSALYTGLALEPVTHFPFGVLLGLVPAFILANLDFNLSSSFNLVFFSSFDNFLFFLFFEPGPFEACKDSNLALNRSLNS